MKSICFGAIMSNKVMFGGYFAPKNATEPVSSAIFCTLHTYICYINLFRCMPGGTYLVGQDNGLRSWIWTP